MKLRWENHVLYDYIPYPSAQQKKMIEAYNDDHFGDDWECTCNDDDVCDNCIIAGLEYRRCAEEIINSI